MGWKPKADEDTNSGTKAAQDAGPAPGKTTRTQALPPGKAKEEPAPARGASLGDLLAGREGDDPFGLHLLDDAAPGRSVRERLPSEAYVERLVWNDYALLATAKGDIASADQYVARVKKTWGSLDAYLEWRDHANVLLDKPLSSGGTVRRLINEHGDTQRVFFYWVSREYSQRGLDDAAILALFDAQIIGEMRDAVAGAEAKLGAKIPIQGFCPRPQRNSKGYVMGTLSEHGLGRAVDIEPDKNPIVDNDVWHRMEAIVGRKVDRSRRRWEEHPEELYDELVAFSERWASIVKEQIATAKRAPVDAANFGRRHPGTLVNFGGVGSPDATPHPLLDEIPAEDSDKNLPAKTIARLLSLPEGRVGNLAAAPGYEIVGHPRRRVLALREQGLVWGATFSNVDLHHFEMASPALAPWFVSEHRRPPTRTDVGGPARSDEI